MGCTSRKQHEQPHDGEETPTSGMPNLIAVPDSEFRDEIRPDVIRGAPRLQMLDQIGELAGDIQVARARYQAQA